MTNNTLPLSPLTSAYAALERDSLGRVIARTLIAFPNTDPSVMELLTNEFARYDARALA